MTVTAPERQLRACRDRFRYRAALGRHFVHLRLDDIAAALGISRATVKTQLNRVYRKCGVTGQGGLIRLVSELAGG